MDHERVEHLTREVFTPSLQQALTQARAQGGTDLELIHAAANAYQEMLLTVLGADAAAKLMQDHAQHVARIAERRQDGSG
jgi:hypothetical protein